jgi:hypothetical protein
MIHGSYSRKHKRDATHADIAEVLQAFGWKVEDTSAVAKFIPGFPDMVIGLLGVTDMVEAKSGDAATFTPAQIEFRKHWKGAPIVNLASKQAAIEWATRTRHERRRASAACAKGELPACIHRHKEVAA